MILNIFKKTEIPKSEQEWENQIEKFNKLFTWSNKHKLKKYIKNENQNRLKPGIIYDHKVVDTRIKIEFNTTYLRVEIPNEFRTLSNIYKNLYSVHNREKYLPRGELICKILDEDKKNKALIKTRIYTDWPREATFANYKIFEKSISIDQPTKVINFIIKQIEKIKKEGYGADLQKKTIKKNKSFLKKIKGGK